MSQRVAFSVTEGLRLRTTRRGPRVATGPRVARIHVGSGKAEATGDHAAWRWWSTLAVPSGPRGTPGRGRERRSAWTDQRSHLDTLLTAHERPVVRARRPKVPSDRDASGSSRRRRLADATAGIPWWHVPSRLAARRTTRHHLDTEVARHPDAGQGDDQAEADRWWAALEANDEPVVLEHLDRWYRTSALPATPTGVVGSIASVVVPADTPERLIGRREPSMDDDGQDSLPLMGRARRNELYVRAIGSAVVAVAAETFAAAPGIQVVAAAVVEPAHPAGPAVIALSELERAVVLPDGTDRPQVSDLELAAAEGRVRLVLERFGQARAPRPLPREYPQVEVLLDILDVEA